MKKTLIALSCILIVIFFAGCGSILVDLNTPKSTELSSQFEYYRDSVDKIRTEMKIILEKSDEVFIVLSDIGLDSKITHIYERKESKTGDTYYKVYWSGKDVNVYMKDGVVDIITRDRDILYPEEKLFNVLMDYDFKVKDIKNGSGTAVIGQRAYISIPNYRMDNVTDYNLKEFAFERVEGSGYNWVSIFYDDGTGICFTGSSPLMATYGKIDSEGIITEVIGNYTLNDNGDYVYSENQ